MKKLNRKNLLTKIACAMLSFGALEANAELIIDGQDSSSQRQVIASPAFTSQTSNKGELKTKAVKTKKKMQVNQKSVVKQNKIINKDLNPKENKVLNDKTSLIEKDLVENKIDKKTEENQKESVDVLPTYNNPDVVSVGKRVVYEKINGRGELPLKILLENIVPENWSIEIDEGIDLNDMVKFEGSKYWDEIVAELNFVTQFDWDSKKLSIEKKDPILNQETEDHLKQEIISVENLGEVKSLQANQEERKNDNELQNKDKEVNAEVIEVNKNTNTIVEKKPDLIEVKTENNEINKELTNNEVSNDIKERQIEANPKSDTKEIKSVEINESLKKGFTDTLIGEKKFIDEENFLKIMEEKNNNVKKIEEDQEFNSSNLNKTSNIVKKDQLNNKTEVKKNLTKNNAKKQKKKKKYIRATNGIVLQ